MVRNNDFVDDDDNAVLTLFSQIGYYYRRVAICLLTCHGACDVHLRSHTQLTSLHTDTYSVYG